MKKVLLIILAFIIIQPQILAAPKKMIPTSSNSDQLPNIFIYTIPNDNDVEINDTIYIDEESNKEDSETEITLFSNEDNQIISATTLKGYAQYVEDASAIHRKDSENTFALNIKEPQKINSTKSIFNKNKPKSNKLYSIYSNTEYKIAPRSIKASGKSGDFTFGATYDSEIDNIAMLETETGLFTKFEKNKFALSSSFKKSLNTTFGEDYNTISITPELKLNDYMSFKNTLSSDITRRRNSSQLVFSVNPFGQKDPDRLLFEVGAKHTTYQDSGFVRTKFIFSTKFKL